MIIILVFTILGVIAFAKEAKRKGYPVLKIAMYPLLIGFIATCLGSTIIFLGQKLLSSEGLKSMFHSTVHLFTLALYLTVLKKYWQQVKSLPKR